MDILLSKMGVKLAYLRFLAYKNDKAVTISLLFIISVIILASDFFEKYYNTYLKLEIRVVRKELLAFKNVFIALFVKNQMVIYICTSEILKTHV